MQRFIDSSVKIGEGTALGQFVVIGENAEIGKDCIIGNNVVIHPGTRIGDHVRIDDNTVIGKQPMKAVASATTKIEKLSPAKIGDDCIIGTSVVISWVIETR